MGSGLPWESLGNFRIPCSIFIIDFHKCYLSSVSHVLREGPPNFLL
jgi:hypothetical protein